MTWFRVDDQFSSHEKVRRIPRSIRAEAIGTWTLCGTWAALHERDGYVPAYVVDDLGGTTAGADALVEVKLWRKRKDGYQFINWEQFQYTREQNDARRESERVRKAEQRAAAKARRDAGSSDGVPLGQVPGPDSPSRPVPSRPEPSDLTDETGSVSPVAYLNARAARTTDQGSPQDDSHVDIDRVMTHVHDKCNRDIERTTAMSVASLILDRARRFPNKPTAYIIGAITKDPFGWQSYIDTGKVPA